MDRIFRDKMSELYGLAFLLTGDRERSVQAYTGALNSEAPAPALQGFMHSWARRLVIVAAIGTIRSQLRASALRNQAGAEPEVTGQDCLAPADLTGLTRHEVEEVLLGMDVLQRCAVILTILEKLPVKDAAELLGVDKSTLKAAQARGVTQMTWKLVGMGRPVSRRTFVRGESALVAFG
jgi:DNA-directed RNA polymerase specialized sigma24 family protein